MKIHKNKWNVEDSSVCLLGCVGDVGRSTKPLMSLPEGSDGIEGIGIYWHLYSWDFRSYSSFIGLYAYMIYLISVL